VEEGYGEGLAVWAEVEDASRVGREKRGPFSGTNWSIECIVKGIFDGEENTFKRKRPFAGIVSVEIA
jgi:hypothetical protein